MNNKQHQIFFIVAVSCLLIGLGLGYFIFNNKEKVEDYHQSSCGEQDEEHREALPPGLMEGVIYSIDVVENVIVVDVRKPQEVAGERVKVFFDIERTDFVELLLEVYDPDDVKDVERKSLDYTLIKEKDEVLVDVGGVVVDDITEEKPLTANTITLITIK